MGVEIATLGVAACCQNHNELYEYQIRWQSSEAITSTEWHSLDGTERGRAASADVLGGVPRRGPFLLLQSPQLEQREHRPARTAVGLSVAADKEPRKRRVE